VRGMRADWETDIRKPPGGADVFLCRKDGRLPTIGEEGVAGNASGTVC